MRELEFGLWQSDSGVQGFDDVIICVLCKGQYDSLLVFGGLWEREGKSTKWRSREQGNSTPYAGPEPYKINRAQPTVSFPSWPFQMAKKQQAAFAVYSAAAHQAKNLSNLFCLESLELIACWSSEGELEFLKNSWELFVVRSGENGRWSTCSYKFYWNEIYLIIMRLIFWRAVCPEQWFSNFVNKLPLRGKGNEFKLYKCGLELSLKGEDFFDVSCFVLDIWDFCLLLCVTSVSDYLRSKVYWCCRLCLYCSFVCFGYSGVPLGL